MIVWWFKGVMWTRHRGTLQAAAIAQSIESVRPRLPTVEGSIDRIFIHFESQEAKDCLSSHSALKSALALNALWRCCSAKREKHDAIRSYKVVSCTQPAVSWGPILLSSHAPYLFRKIALLLLVDTYVACWTIMLTKTICRYWVVYCLHSHSSLYRHSRELRKEDTEKISNAGDSFIKLCSPRERCLDRWVEKGVFRRDHDGEGKTLTVLSRCW